MKAHRFIPMMRIIRSAMHSVILFRPEKCVLNCSCKNFGISFTALPDGEQINTVSNAEEYIQKAETFIKTNVHKKISVSDVAKYIGIDRSYLTRLFNEYKKTSPQNYIISLKMNTAALYLKNTNASVTETAQSVGYYDTHIFNKTFKKQFGVSPTTWRQKQIGEQSIIEK